MSSKHLFVFCYDISSDARRLRAARYLEKCGVRVQESVFEVRTTASRARQMAKTISQRIAPNESLRVYHVPDMALKHSIVSGGAPLPEPGNYLMF